MKLRHYRLFRGYFTAALALITAGLPLFINVDDFGFYFLIVFSPFCALLSYYYFKKAGKTRDEERAFAPPVDATALQQIAYYKKMLIIGAVAFPILTIMTAVNLNSLERGQADGVMLLSPISSLYDTGGYWPAVLAIPFLWILASGVSFWKIHKLNNESENVT